MSGGREMMQGSWHPAWAWTDEAGLGLSSSHHTTIQERERVRGLC